MPLKLREALIFEAHDTKMGGLSGVLRTFKRLATQFYWPSMYKTVHDYVRYYLSKNKSFYIEAGECPTASSNSLQSVG